MYNIDDVITGNESNTYGKTNEFGEYKVTACNGSKISVKVTAHVDSSIIGTEFHGLDAYQFKLLKAAPAKKAAPKAAPTCGYATKSSTTAIKKYDEFDMVTVKDLPVYKSNSTKTHAGSTAKILSYDEYLSYYGCWECTVSFPDGSIGIMLENEMSSHSAKYPMPAKTQSKGIAPVDDDYWMDSPKAGKSSRRKPAPRYSEDEDEDEDVEVVERYTYPETKKVKKDTPKRGTNRFEDEASNYLSTESIPKLDTSALRKRRIPKLRTDL